MGTGIDLFLDWENGIWVAGTGIWPLGMGNEVLKNGIEVMRVDSQFFHVLSILKYNFDPFLVSLVRFLLLTILFTALPANRHTLAPGILGFLIMRAPSQIYINCGQMQRLDSRPQSIVGIERLIPRVASLTVEE
jgi:hypothetical protein